MLPDNLRKGSYRRGLLRASAGITTGEPLSTEERIRITVWNIYKQQRAEWLSVLKNYGKDAHLVLLQEAQTTPELVQFATANYLAADQVPAFVLPQHPSGVMTLSAAHPVYCCPLREREPILRLAKSALVTVYPLPDTRLLMVVNIHAVNFSLGVDVYSKQLLPYWRSDSSPQRPGHYGGRFQCTEP